MASQSTMTSPMMVFMAQSVPVDACVAEPQLREYVAW